MTKQPIILIADDEDSNLRLMEAMLLPLGYDVLMAVNGKEAIQKAREMSPDVILMDIMMPVMNGLEAVKILKQDEETRLIPTVIVTALREVNDRVKALEAGAGYLGGLKGGQIPLAGRIAAIADVFDALSSRRPYKKPFYLEKSFAIIRESRGTQFDPDVVDAYFAVQDEILAIKEEHQG